MGEIINAILLGIIQGLTEFLPVSSSGHLELAKFLLGDNALPEESMLMTVVLHFGTALATMFVFRTEIWHILTHIFQKGNSDEKQFVVKIVLSMIPAAIVGVFFEDAIEQLFNQNILLVCSMLILTGILLLIADRAKLGYKDITISNAIVIGIAQAIAILPGISRSGATISTSVILGIDREKAARFSFLMVVPLIFGKIAKDILDGDFGSHATSIGALGVGFIASFLVGILACMWMINIVKKSKLIYFSIYCFIIGSIGIAYAYIQ